ncbi:hypothetical protein CDD82_3262 [Ophiocordyceps australis]|uniref:GH18 domain-containing protein n=1 Tax=Ophiocordyceps australis TaxID=1399860 RepID=A0A2C5Z824_9HYPO|nr:hypothetical protein CDD82_3262 [Ophiocordyceps australis]
MPPIQPISLPRLILYYQTLHDPNGRHISLLPLLTQPSIAVTHLILAAIHINASPSDLTLNDHPPSHPRYHAVWAELRLLQASGIKVLAMLGGAAKGTYQRLDFPRPTDSDEPCIDRFHDFYPPLCNLLRHRGLDGIDLDVEEPMSLPGIMRLIDRLRADFGPDFIITMAPVATALVDVEKNLSGFDYEALEVMRGAQIAWYNTQFYCGWGDLHTGSTALYHFILRKGWPPSKVVIGLVTNPDNGSGFVPWSLLNLLLTSINRSHAGAFGGVMGWEYFNSMPGGTAEPWQWARHMSMLLRRHALKSPSDSVSLHASLDAPLPHDFDYFSDTCD